MLAHSARIAFVTLALAVAALSAACVSEHTPTAAPATSGPIATLAHSSTGQPSTLVPTWTPEPTATPPPTYTPAPTYTPVSLPTATPYPTPTTRILETPTPTPTPFYGEWATLRDEIDPLTRKRQISIALNEQDGVLRFMGIHLLMWIGCYEDTVRLGVGLASSINSPTVSFNDPTVSFRIGDQPVKTHVWDIPQNGGAPFVSGESAVVMVHDLFTADEFVIRVNPENLDPVTAVFSPAGLYWAVKPVLEACEVEAD